MLHFGNMLGERHLHPTLDETKNVWKLKVFNIERVALTFRNMLLAFSSQRRGIVDSDVSIQAVC